MRKLSFILTLFFILAIHLSTSAQQWELKNPRTGLETLYGVDFYDNNLGVACGSEGRIYVTKNGGQNWTIVSDGTNQYLYTKIAFIKGTNGQKIIIYGNQGTSISLDGGTTFNRTSGYLANIQSLVSTGGDNLYASTLQYGLYKSTDLGATWEQVYEPENLSYRGYGAHFFDDNNGLIIDNESGENVLRKTTDGGHTWTKVNTPDLSFPKDLYFVNDQLGSFIANDGIFLTKNGGQTWNVIESSTSIESVSILDENRISRMANNGSLSHSFDGGQTWEDQEIYPVQQNNFTFVDENLIFSVGSANSIISNLNEGETVVDKIPSYKISINKITMASERIGYAVSAYPFNFLKTINRGETWNIVSTNLDIDSHSADIIVFGENTIYTIVKNELVKSNDGGSTFTTVYDATLVKGIFKFSDDQIYITDINGNIIISDSNFENINIINSSLSGVTDIMLDSEGAYVATTSSGVHKSTDQGITWDLLFEETKLTDIVQTGTQRYFALNSSYNILGFITEDGGESWTEVDSPSDFYKYGIHMISDTVGYVTGGVSSLGKTIKTVDGGKTWKTELSESVPHLELCGAADGSDDIWLVGNNGLIKKYTACNGPEITDLTVGNKNCINETVTIFVTTQFSDIYSWEVPDGWEIESYDDAGNLYVIPNSTSGEVTITASNNCGDQSSSSSVTVDVFDTPEIVISQNSNTLECNVQGETYEWYKNGSYIPGAEFYQYSPESDGNYSVTVYFNNGCIAESESFNFMVTGTVDIDLEKVKIYPNPVSDHLYIDNLPADTFIEIHNISGNNIIKTTQNKIDVSDLTKGVYIMTLTSEKGSYSRKINVR